MFSKSRSFFVLFLLLCTSVLSANAVVSLAKKMLNSLNMVAFIGVQRYSQPITRQLLVKEARTALGSLPGTRRTKPAVVSALWAGGNEAIFASSAKGQGTVPGNDDLQVPTPVQDALKKCAAEFKGKHNYEGKCGEIMVIAEWYRQNPGKTLPQEKLIVAVDKDGVKPPCSANGERSTYGCEQFLEEMKFTSGEIIETEPEEEACEVTTSGDGKDLGKRGCKKPGKAKPGKTQSGTKVPKKVPGSQSRHPKSAPRPVTRKTKQRRRVHPRWNGQMTQ